ncbi:MAG: hypothetical protein ACT4PJ_06245 [Gemmatimonadaceae bacterium]
MRTWVIVGLFGALLQGVTPTLDRLRASWSRQDAPAVLDGATRVVLQMPGEPASPPLGVEQASRALGRLYVDATELGLEVATVRTVGSESAYAEMRRRFRVGNAENTVEQRVFAAFRLEGGRWQLTELRIGPARP